MNGTFSLLTALGAGLVLVPHAFAQTSAAATPAPAAATTAAPTATAAQAVNAKIALVNFEQVVLASNEGQVVTANTQKKYEPKKNEIERESQDVDAKNKALQAAPATLSDADRATRLREIDTASKKLNRDAEDASTAYNAELTEALQKVAQKVAVTAKTYAQQQGYTLLLDVSSQSSNVLWALTSTDISQAIVDQYNKQSGVSAPPPPSPSPRPAAARPSGAARPPAR